MWLRSLVLCLVGAGFLSVGGCAREEHETPAPARALSGQITVRSIEAPDYRSFSAVLTNRDVGDARARIGGTLSRVLVREGQRVTRGQTLAIISDPRLALEAQAGAAQIAAAEAAAQRARGDEARYASLYEQGFLAQARMDQIRAETRAAEAQMRAARAQAGAAAAVSAQGRVIAPADGVVTRLPFPQGAVVMAGDLVVAVATGARVLRLEIPEGEARALSAGQAVYLLRDADGARVRVRVGQVYPAVERGMVTADLDASAFPAGFIGARVRVLAPIGVRNAIVIPARFLTTRYGIDTVRLVRPSGAIDAPVQRGAPLPTEAMPDGVDILSGLADGDVIAPPAQP